MSDLAFDRLSWVRQVDTLDADDKVAIAAKFNNHGLQLLHVGSGKGGQTTLTFGWGWDGQFERSVTEADDDQT